MKTKSKKDARSRGKWQGMNWCRKSTRLAIYLRDGLACAWCGAPIEEGTTFGLDHLLPHSKGGTNSPSNLVTACHRCNSSRGARSLPEFARVVADYLNHGKTRDGILAHVRACAKRSMKGPRLEAREILKRRQHEGSN